MIERAVWWPLPVAAFVIAALVTVVLRVPAGDRGPPPLPVAGDVAARMPVPRLAPVPELPAPLRPPKREPAASAPEPPAPAPTPTPAPAPATGDTPAVPAQPTVPEPPPPEPPVAAPRPTPAPTFDDSGSGPEFDDSGPGP